MRRQLTAYVTDEEFTQLRTEAEERGISLSRYIMERLVHGSGHAGIALSDSRLAATEKRLVDANRASIAQSIKPIARQLTTLLTMLDQFALSTLIHLPEVPEPQRKQAIAAGERRHRGWRLEVEEILNRMEAPALSRKMTASHEGDHA